MPRDSQRGRVYKFGSRIRYGDIRSSHNCYKEMTLDECKKLVDKIFKNETTEEAPRIGAGQGCSSAHYITWGHIIQLPKNGRNELTILHEVAHALQQGKLRWRVIAAHGPEYMSVFIYLLNKYLKLNKEKLLEAAFECKIQIAFDEHPTKYITHPIVKE